MNTARVAAGSGAPLRDRVAGPRAGCRGSSSGFTLADFHDHLQHLVESTLATIPAPARSFVQRFSTTRRGVRLTRLPAAHQLAEWGHPHGTEAHDTVVLVVGELTANAVLHGRVPGRDSALRLARDDGRA